MSGPIDMLLACPSCGWQHIDRPETHRNVNGACERCLRNCTGADEDFAICPNGWQNPPHKSHLCHACGFIWRPADVETNGVESIATRGEVDSPAPTFPPVSVARAIDVLNSAFRADSQAVERIMRTFSACNQDLVNHATIQADGAGYVGPLGIINGIFGVDAEGWGAIAAVFEDGKLLRFERCSRKAAEDRIRLEGGATR